MQKLNAEAEDYKCMWSGIVRGIYICMIIDQEVFSSSMEQTAIDCQLYDYDYIVYSW